MTLNDCNTNQSTHLHQAVQNNEYSLAQSLLIKKLYVDTTDKEGKTPLHLAARFGYYSLSKLLLAYHANIYHVDKAGRTVLHEAFFDFGKKNPVVPLLIAHGAPINRIDYYEKASVLHHAAWFGDEEAVTALLAHQDAVNLIDLPSVYGETPLHRAARSGNPNVVALLLKAGSHYTAINLKGETPLQSALFLGKRVIPSLIPLLKILFLENPAVPKPHFIIEHSMFSSLWDRWLESYHNFHKQLNLSTELIYPFNKTDLTMIQERTSSTSVLFSLESSTKQLTNTETVSNSSTEK
nr:ankyrin repeat domain-containing protein [Rickettsiella massiliensis]